MISDAQNPSIYNRPEGGCELVTSYGGSIGIFRSQDLLTWTLFDAKLPFRGDCPSLFDWHGHRYLLQGFTNMAYSPDGAPGSFVNWTNEPDKLYEGLSVPMVTSWKDGRRLIGGVRGLDADYEVKVVAYYDAKADATLFDAEVAGQRTLICRREGRFTE